MATKKPEKISKTAVKKDLKLEETVNVISFILKELEQKHNKLEQKVIAIEEAAKMVMSRMGLQGEYRGK